MVLPQNFGATEAVPREEDPHVIKWHQKNIENVNAWSVNVLPV